MEGSAPDSAGVASAWLRCYRCWSQNLKVELHYEGVLRVDPQTGEAYDPDDEMQEAVIQCRDCLHDQPHLSLAVYEENGRRISRVEAVEDRWERMVVGTPWVASCTVTVDGDGVDCQGPDAADALAYAAFGDHGTREFFTHVRFHKHEGDAIVVHTIVELYARSPAEATCHTRLLATASRGCSPPTGAPTSTEARLSRSTQSWLSPGAPPGGPPTRGGTRRAARAGPRRPPGGRAHPP